MKAIALLFLSAAICVAQSPPMPPGVPLKKKVVPLLSPKAMSQKTVLMKKAPTLSAAAAPMAAASMAADASGNTVSRVTAVVVNTDGTNVISLEKAVALKFVVPNPKKDHYVISVSGDLNDWQVIYQNVGDDPIVLYDFTYLTTPKNFYRIAIDDSLR